MLFDKAQNKVKKNTMYGYMFHCEFSKFISISCTHFDLFDNNIRNNNHM